MPGKLCFARTTCFVRMGTKSIRRTWLDPLRYASNEAYLQSLTITSMGTYCNATRPLTTSPPCAVLGTLHMRIRITIGYGLYLRARGR